MTDFTLVRGFNRGMRHGFVIGDYNSGFIYNNEQHATTAAQRYLGKEVRGSKVTERADGRLGKRAIACLKKAGKDAKEFTIGQRF